MSNLYDIPPNCRGSDNEEGDGPNCKGVCYNDDGDGISIASECLAEENTPFISQNTYTETTIRKREDDNKDRQFSHSEEKINSIVAEKKLVSYTKKTKSTYCNTSCNTKPTNTERVMRSVSIGVGPDRPLHQGGGGGGGGGDGNPNGGARGVIPLIEPTRDTDTLIVPLDGLRIEDTKTGTLAKVLSILALALIVCTFPFSMIFCFKVILQYERAVVLRLGRIAKGGCWGPGLCFYLPCLDEIKVVDMRTLSFEVPPQEVLTRDSVTVSVDAVVYFRISSPVASVCNVEDVEQSSRLLAQTTLRNIIGTKSLNELLAEREAVSRDLKNTLDTATERWGVVVERVEIKDVRLPPSLQRSMAAEAEASREARAKEVAAQGEKDAAQALKDASDELMQSPCSIQLRYLQALTSISSGGGESSTIVFPIPVNLLKCLGNFVTTASQPIYENINPVIRHVDLA